MTKTVKRPCLVCGSPVTFYCYLKEEVGHRVCWHETCFILSREEVGWADAECKKCGFHIPAYYVEKRMQGKPEGFIVSGGEVNPLIYIPTVLKECNAAAMIAKGVK
jgi:hypothetical protein